jgi:membrane-associated protease RseP (regulator of RpoE activity)
MKSIAVFLTLFVAAGANANPSPTPPAQPDAQTFEMSFTSGPGRLGIAAVKISSELRAHYGAPSDRGVLVDSVRPDGVAAKAGVKVGDVILEVDAQPVRSAADVVDAMGDRKKGDAVAIDVVRAGARTRLTATLDRDAPPATTFGHRDMQRWMDTWPRAGFGADRNVERMIREMQRRLEQLERRFETKPLDGAGRQRT